MKTAYFNCASGISGNMILGALIDAGLSGPKLEAVIKKAVKGRGLDNFWKLSVKPVEDHHLPGTYVEVVNGEKRFVSVKIMRSAIKHGALPEWVKEKSLSCFDKILAAEARVHHQPLANVHLHELSSWDTLVDIIGSFYGLYLLDIQEVYSSPLNLGAPAPAAMKILKGVPVYSSSHQQELTTPTGAAIITTLAGRFSEMPRMKIIDSGRGTGSLRFADRPNQLQIIIGEIESVPKEKVQSDTVVLLETNIDDMDTRLYPYISEKLLASGALDVWITNVAMKKGRPGFVISVISPLEKEPELRDLLFIETTTIGIRRQVLDRWVLPRSQKGNALRKTVLLPNGKKKCSVEFSSAEALAQKNKKVLRDIL